MNFLDLQNSTTLQFFPSQLWFGPHDHVLAKVVEYLQKVFCPNTGCFVCATCHKIREQQHHAIRWIYPEKQYTLEDIECIFSTISFALNPDEHYFFILQKADFLTIACANSLLKSMEEPPAGYHFILLAERQEQMLPTIRSRCIIQSFYSKDYQQQSPLFNCFAHVTLINPIEFATILDQSKINERESIELLDALLAYWIKQFQTAIAQNNQEAQKKASRVIECLKKAYEIPPMPGSSKIFWKNVYLMMK